MGLARNPDALRRNPTYVREKLRKWRANNPERFELQQRRNEKTRNDKYRENPSAYLLKSARARAKIGGYECNIDELDLKIPEYCPITGQKIDILTNTAAHGASVDRVDNALGYIKGNIRVISRKANRMKGDNTIADLEKILAYMRGEI